MASYKLNLFQFMTFITLAMSPSLLRADVATDWCGRTNSNSLCLSIVNDDRLTNLKTSPNGIATILRDKAVATSVSASLKIAKLFQDAKDKRTKDSLLRCSTDYFETINTLTTANFKTINRDTYSTLVKVISTGNDKPADCEIGFQKPPAIRSPVTGENVSLRQITSTTLEIISLVVCNKPSAC